MDEQTLAYFGLLTIIVFLLPAFIIRFAIVKQQLSVGWSLAVAAGTLLAFTALQTLERELGGTASTIGPAVASFVSFFICRYKKERIW